MVKVTILSFIFIFGSFKTGSTSPESVYSWTQNFSLRQETPGQIYRLKLLLK